MEALKNVMFKNWHLMRWIRLGAAILFVWRMYTMKEWVLGIIGLFLLYQVIFNLGCGPKGCSLK